MKPRKHADLSWACGLAVALVAVTLAGPGIWAAVPAIVGIYTLMGAGARLAAVLVGASLAAAIYVIEVVRRAGDHEGFLWMRGVPGVSCAAGVSGACR